MERSVLECREHIAGTMNCKDCKCWERWKGEIYGQCDSLKVAYGHEHEIKVGDEAFYMDCETYGAGLFLGENFGCIHFEKK